MTKLLRYQLMRLFILNPGYAYRVAQFVVASWPMVEMILKSRNRLNGFGAIQAEEMPHKTKR